MKVYSPAQVKVSFQLVPVEAGRADGEFVRYEDVDPDKYAFFVGVDGEVTRVEKKNELVLVTLILAQSSSTNAILSTMLHVDRASPNGAGIGPFLMTDLSGLSLLADPQASLVGWPSGSMSNEVTPREWRIMLPNPTRFEGGN